MKKQDDNMTPEGLIKGSKEAQSLYDKRQYLAGICKPALQHAKDARRRYDYEWMVRDMFRRGYQFSRWQPSTNTLTLATRSQAKIPVNILASQMRSIRNQVTSFRPKFEVLPRNLTEESKTQARYSGKLLDYLFDHLKLKDKIKKTVTQGLMYSIGGPWQIVYDEEKEEVNVWLVDPFDFFFDPLAESLEDAEFVIKAVRRPLSEVLTSPLFYKYAKKEVTGPEARLAVSEYKQFMIQSLRYVTPYNKEENPTVILFEGNFKQRDEKGKVHIRKVIWTDQNITPLYWEETEDETYDYVIYHADLNPKEILGEGWMRHTMPINRVINSLESSVFDYNYRVAKGRIVVDRDSGVRAIHNLHGEIISKNRGAEVRALDMPALPTAVAAQIDRMNRYMEDIGGAHDASLGRVPAGVKSGIGVAELKQADSTNQDDLVDNMEDFLTDVAMKILQKIAKYYKKYKVIQHLGYREDEAKYFAVVGKNAKKEGNVDEAHKNQIKVGPDWIDIAIIGEDNNIRVTIGSWLGYTKEMMQEKVIKYAQLGIIDQKTALRLLEFGGIDEIVHQTRIETLLKKNISNPNQPGASPGEQDQYGLAMTENEMIVFENKPVPVSENDDHFVHLALHQEALGRGNDELLKVHMDKHRIFAGQEPTMPQEQETPPEDQMRNQQIAGGPPTPGGAPGQTGLNKVTPWDMAGLTQGMQAIPKPTPSIAQQVENVPNA